MRERIVVGILLLLLGLSSVVSAATVIGLNGQAFAEYPAKIDSFRPFQVKLTINDSEMQEYANAIIADNNCYYFRILPVDVTFLPLDADADKQYAQFMKYDHEDEVVFTLLSSRYGPIEYNGYEQACTFRFFFLPTEETRANPPVMSNGRVLSEKTLLSEITIKPVRSDYAITMNLPQWVEKYSFSTPINLFANKYSADNDGIAYSISAQLMRYANGLDENGMGYYTGTDWKFDLDNFSYRRHFEVTTRLNWYSGNMFDKESEIKKLQIGPFGKIPVEDGYYRIYTSVYDAQDYGRADKKDMVQVKIMFHGQAYMKNAFVNFKFEKTVDTEKGSEESVMTQGSQDLLALAKSYMITTQPIEELSLQANKKKKEKEKITDPVIFGTVADGDHHPMPYMELVVYVGRDVFKTTTTESGDFKITLTGKEIFEDEPLAVKLGQVLSYNRDGKNYFDIRYRKVSEDRYYLVEILQKMNLTEQNTEVHQVLDGTPNPGMTVSQGITQWRQIKSLSVMYYHFHEAVEFSLNKLNANIDYKLPVNVYVGNAQDKTLYSPTNSDILISLHDSSYSSSNRPKNREYHEFAHHLMYATYGAWPAGRMQPGVVNHDGFLNANTADSYLEGFAEFMAMAIAKENGDRTPEMYASFGSQENNYMPWDAGGYDEEFAVSSLLWDLYDTKNDAGDSIAMSLDDIWNVLKVNRKDFYEYYLAFKQANPSKQEGIDKLFIAHGFFANPDVGNKKRDAFEGFRDANDDGNYSRDEFFVDYGANATAQLIYRTGMVVGRAANYERMNRSSAVRVPNAYLKVQNPEVRWYTVKVDLHDPSLGEDYEYQVDVRDGLVYLQPLPIGYEASITVVPYSQDYTSQAPYTTTAAKLIDDIQQATGGYIEEHDFKLKATGLHVDEEYYLPEGVEPTYAYEGDLDDMKGVSLKVGSSGDDSSGGAGRWVVVVLVLIVIGLAVWQRAWLLEAAGLSKAAKRKRKR